MSFVLALDYDAHDGCPARAAFEEQVVARTAKARFGDGGEVVVIHIVRDGERSHGELVLDGGETRRALDGPACADVVSGLAFALALAVDARPETAAPPSTSPPTPPLERDVAPPLVARPAARRPRRWVTGFATEGSSIGAVAIMIGPWARFRHEAWSVRVSAITGSASIERASFRRLLGTAEACYGPAIAGCAGIEAGLLRASGVGVADATTVNRAWFAPTLAARAEARFLDALVFEARAGLAMPLVRDTFVLVPSTTLHRTPAIAPFVGVAIGVTIP